MPERTVEDLLRAEYVQLVPEIRRVVWQLETEIRFRTLPILHSLSHHEQLIVKARVKDCESAIRALQRRQEGRVFDPQRPGDYSLLHLPDLAGVRVLIFPRSRVLETDRALSGYFTDWNSDPVKDEGGMVLTQKYNGYCRSVSERVRAEYQIVPMLIGLFWEVEHSAMYKPDPSLMGIARSAQMKRLKTGVEDAVLRFEEGFESFLRENR